MSFTYSEVGATRDAELPVGTHHLSVREAVGPADGFERAAEFVLTWGMQRAAGFAVEAAHPRAEEGVEVSMRARFGPLRLIAPTRVVYVVDEPDRRGFAYGTLPGHPESGEELFLVERLGGVTWVEVRAFTRPGRWYSRLGRPVVLLLQRRIVRQYVDAVRTAVIAE